MATDLTEKTVNPFTVFKTKFNDKYCIDKFRQVLGSKTDKYMASVVAVVGQTEALQKCTVASLIGASMACAITGLDVSPSLGQAALVPFTKKMKVGSRWEDVKICQFMVMKKGLIQLAIRSGQYKTINSFVVYEDELESFNPFSNELKLKEPLPSNGFRKQGRNDKIIGYGSFFKLLNGFEQWSYWTKEEVLAHAKKFSQSWNSEDEKFRHGSAWDSHFDAMAKKTVLKLSLSNYGYLTTELQNAIRYDSGTINNLDNLDEVEYVDNPQSNSNVVKEAISEAKEVAKEVVTANTKPSAETVSQPSDEEIEWAL